MNIMSATPLVKANEQWQHNESGVIYTVFSCRVKGGRAHFAGGRYREIVAYTLDYEAADEYANGHINGKKCHWSETKEEWQFVSRFTQSN